MFRQSFFAQRKLFLLVFLWTCLCLVIFKQSSLFNSTPLDQQVDQQHQHQHQQHQQSQHQNHQQSQQHQQRQQQRSIVDENDSKPTKQARAENESQCKYNYPSLFELQFNNIHWQKFSMNPSEQVEEIIESDDDDDDDENDHYHYDVSDKAAADEKRRLRREQNLIDSPITTTTTTTTTTRATTNNSTISKNKSTPATYYLYNAYYDDRWRGGLPSIRILAMIDRIEPPPTNCLLWSSHLREDNKLSKEKATTSTSTLKSSSLKDGPLKPLVTRATFVYAWYPKWGNYKDGILQPWIVTCQMPRAHVGLVPDSVSLVSVAPLIRKKKKTYRSSSSIIQLESTLSSPAPLSSSLSALDLPSSSSSSVPSSSAQIQDLIEWNGQYFNARTKRNSNLQQQSDNNNNNIQAASIAMPPSFSSSLPTIQQANSRQINKLTNSDDKSTNLIKIKAKNSNNSNNNNDNLNDLIEEQEEEYRYYDCKRVQQLPITNNLPIFNNRPKIKQKFAVCVKGLDFPHEDVSVRLIEWIELLNLLGAGKIFLYNLDVHENISKVLDYYQKRGIVELSPLTLPGDQPNLPEYQHLYLKNRLTAKRQNELIPYNDCLYRNLNSYQYLALLDIDEIIMPMKENHFKWHDLMEQVELLSLHEQNYSRASYNVRNVYFFDDLAGPLGTTSSSSSSSASSLSSDDDDDEIKNDNNNNLERGIPHYLHMMQHVYRSKNYTKPGQYVKCFHNTERVVSLHNHFPMNCFGQCTTYSIPIELAHLQHYRKDCVGPLKQSCKNDYRAFTTRDTTIWKFKQQMIRRTTRVLNHLGLLTSSKK